MVEREVSSI